MFERQNVTLALFGESEERAPGRVIDIPLSLDGEINRFLSRWCHRAMGDRVAAEQELRALIERARNKD